MPKFPTRSRSIHVNSKKNDITTDFDNYRILIFFKDDNAIVYYRELLIVTPYKK